LNHTKVDVLLKTLQLSYQHFRLGLHSNDDEIINDLGLIIVENMKVL